MKNFIYPLQTGVCIYTFGRNERTNCSLKLLEDKNPCLIDCFKFDNLTETIKELNIITGCENKNIIEFEFPIIFIGKDLIGNYDDLIHYLKTEIQ